jgi:hypothetical protein
MADQEESYRGSGRLQGRKAPITGGDSGIGRAAAIACAREGADVAINYLPAEQPDADEVVKYIEGAGRKAVAIPGDIREEDFGTSLVMRCFGSRKPPSPISPGERRSSIRRPYRRMTRHPIC